MDYQQQRDREREDIGRAKAGMAAQTQAGRAVQDRMERAWATLAPSPPVHFPVFPAVYMPTAAPSHADMWPAGSMPVQAHGVGSMTEAMIPSSPVTFFDAIKYGAGALGALAGLATLASSASAGEIALAVICSGAFGAVVGALLFGIVHGVDLLASLAARIATALLRPALWITGIALAGWLALALAHLRI